MDISEVEKIKEWRVKFNQETSSNWNTDDEWNRLFLATQQNYANQRLQSIGHVFLNEIFDMLGLARTQSGVITGWVISDEPSYVDFGLYREDHDVTPEDLVFNVQGIIWDKI
jgi:Family of unknown function (DUF6353)